MCGIAGVVNYSGKQVLSNIQLSQFAESLKFRGPDQEGYSSEIIDNISIQLAHKRLSVIDLSEKANQPFTSVSENTTIVYNGEIYNYQALRKELLAAGMKFKSDSDTEVLLNGYEYFGIEGLLNKIDGMFAFMLYDRKRQTCTLVRDRMGQKPLYYYIAGDTLCFSSDIRSFKIFPGNLTLDYYSLGYYLSELSTPGEHTIWTQIKKLSPGYYLEFDKADWSINQYWDIDYEPKNFEHSPQDILSSTEQLLEKAVKKRLVADVPVGTFLSGGIDSGLVTAFAALNYEKKLNTFTVGFSDEKYNELPLAKKVSEKYNTEHHEIILNPNDIDLADQIIGEFGEPFADSSMIPTYYISSFASKKLKVILSGDGGDELFGGYPTYIHAKRMETYYKWKGIGKLLPMSKLGTINERMGRLNDIFRKDKRAISQALFRNMGFNEAELTKLLKGHPNVREAMGVEYDKVCDRASDHCIDIFDAVLYGSLKTRLLNDYLVKVDRAAMFASLEVRSPFLDKSLLEYTSKLDHEQLMPQSKKKFILKEIAKKYLPEEILVAKKKGFEIPIGLWLRKDLKEKFIQVVVESRQTLVPFNYEYINELFARHLSGEDHTHKLWALYVFHKWVSA